MTAPKISDAPGLAWKPRKGGWEARWQARTDLVRRGFTPKSARLWAGIEADLTETTVAMIQDQCHRLQSEMLVWGRGGLPVVMQYDGTLRSLVNAYQTDADSTYRKARYNSRIFYDTLCRRIVTDHGPVDLTEIKARTLLRWHENWTERGVSMAHALVGMLRTLVNFGATILEDDECERVAGILHRQKFTMGKPRNSILTAEQANMIRARAHEKGRHSIALAQAFQFECMLRQKDVLGEWVPQSEPGISEITFGNSKWLRGIRWNEIDANMILRHVTSKRNKEVEINLTLAPMVMEELGRFAELPDAGPVIIDEHTGQPWVTSTFRHAWRKIADECGIPKTVRNMDSRAGAISEATDAGADLEHVRHAATHGDIAMTQRYSRSGADKTAGVMMKRVAHRNKK